MSDLYFAKKNLESFKTTHIDLLADYFGIHQENPNDRLWLVALSIHSKKRGTMPPSLLADANYLQQLHDDQLFDIITYIDWADIVNLCKTSKEFNTRVCENEEFWKRLLLTRFPKKYLSKTIPMEGTWKSQARTESNLDKKLLKQIGLLFGKITTAHNDTEQRESAMNLFQLLDDNMWYLRKHPDFLKAVRNKLEEFAKTGGISTDVAKLFWHMTEKVLPRNFRTRGKPDRYSPS